MSSRTLVPEDGLGILPHARPRVGFPTHSNFDMQPMQGVLVLCLFRVESLVASPLPIGQSTMLDRHFQLSDYLE